jgi:hypothetical protein
VVEVDGGRFELLHSLCPFCLDLTSHLEAVNRI